MEASFKSNNQVSKAEQYDIFLQQFASLIEGETHEVSVLANTCAALKEAFPRKRGVLPHQERTGRMRHSMGRTPHPRST